MRGTSAAEVTRQNLIDAYWKLFKAKGRDGMSVKEVAQLAGYNRSTFYEYFRGLPDVLLALEERLLPTAAQHKLQVDFLTARMPLDTLLRKLFRLLEGNLEPFCLLMAPEGDPAFRALFFERWRPCFAARLQQENAISPSQADVAAQFLIAGLLGMTQRTLERSPGITEEELIAQLLDCCGQLPLAQSLVTGAA